MGIFGKKRDEDDYEEDDELELENDQEERKLTRKFKDLNPENKKKRIEPPKPWGKKERLIILTIFLSTLIIAGILSLTSRNIVFSGFNFNFEKPNFSSFNIFKDGVIEIRKK
ncbi:MAG TPA: hypothetical protein VFI61_04455 [Patescibacteria group bacterium]|nr:hypothetical protein [Patescibacteria group bacterium]